MGKLGFLIILRNYKTGKTTLPKSKLKDDVQLALYYLAVKELYGKMPVQAGLLYVNPEVRELRMMDVDEERRGSRLWWMRSTLWLQGF